MATKSKFRELSLGPSEPITRRNSVAGMQVVSDYLDPITNQRTLLLKRIESPLMTTGTTPKPKVARKRRASAKTNAGARVLDTSIQPAGVPDNG